MREAGLPEPVFDFDKHSFSVRLESKRVGEKVTKNQKKIIQFIIKNKCISAKELSILVGISSRKIEENIAKLKQKGFLKRIGSAKGGHWEVLK